MDLRQENSRLRHENREREKFWRALYQARKTGQVPETEDLPPPPLSSPFSGHAPVSSALSSHSSTPLVQHAYGNGGGYREDNSGAYNPGSASSGSFASQQTPTSFSHRESIDGSSSRSLSLIVTQHIHILFRDLPGIADGQRNQRYLAQSMAEKRSLLPHPRISNRHP